MRSEGGGGMRLTKKADNERLIKNGFCYMSKDSSVTMSNIVNKLGELEDLEEQGRLMEVVYGFDKSDYPSAFECSVCGFCDWDTYTADDGVYNYCPRCGAKIEELKGE